MTSLNPFEIEDLWNQLGITTLQLRGLNKLTRAMSADKFLKDEFALLLDNPLNSHLSGFLQNHKTF